MRRSAAGSFIITLARMDEARGGLLPQRQTGGSFGFDLELADDVAIGVNQTVLAGTGWRLAEDLPYSIAMLILPRSSLFLKHGLIIPNSPGLVDMDYAGEIKVMLHRLRQANEYGYVPPDNGHHIPRGTRVAQLFFVQNQYVKLEEGFADETRTRQGFGSTG